MARLTLCQVSVEYDMECNKKRMLNYLHPLRHLESSLLPALIFFFPLSTLLLKGLGQASVSAGKVMQERNVIVVRLGIGATQTASVVTAAWLGALMRIPARNLVFVK